MPWDHPRIRGEHSQRHNPKGDFTGSSPHTRGALPERTPIADFTGIIPAYAGSTWRRTGTPPRRWDHPRIRGEHSWPASAASSAAGSSPHTRGARSLRRSSFPDIRIIPAYAGSTLRGEPARRILGDHPRIRGEHTDSGPFHDVSLGSSPHTRGAPAPSPSRPRRRRIIPAYAGSTEPPRGADVGEWDHPRIRGEHTSGCVTRSSLTGSSPHTRGARRSSSRWSTRRGIIPAYAGSTPWRCPSADSAWDHPRIRGEHITVTAEADGVKGSSPHTRGARHDVVVWLVHVGIIPAYAGSTRAQHSVPEARRDHPRIRGEHECLGQWSRRDVGSSPHTRGAQV